jgi:hypothetical protein
MARLWKSHPDFHSRLEISLENARFPHFHKPIIVWMMTRRTIKSPNARGGETHVRDILRTDSVAPLHHPDRTPPGSPSS